MECLLLLLLLPSTSGTAVNDTESGDIGGDMIGDAVGMALVEGDVAGESVESVGFVGFIGFIGFVVVVVVSVEVVASLVSVVSDGVSVGSVSL